MNAPTFIFLFIVITILLVAVWSGLVPAGVSSDEREQLQDKWLLTILLSFSFLAVVADQLFPLIGRKHVDNILFDTVGLISIGIGMTLATIIGILLYRWKREGWFVGLVVIGTLVWGPLSTSGVIRLLNGLLDRSPSKVHQVYLLRKESSRGTGGTGYTFYVTDWARPGNEARIRVYARIYDKYQEHDQCKVVVGRGFFDFEWLKSVQ